MIPTILPVGLTADCAPFGEHPFQPYLIQGSATVVAGGPSALFLIRATAVPKFLLTIPARVRISGFAVHEGTLYVQDGPVLSRWSIVNYHCDAAINLLQPKQNYFRTTSEPNWSALHKLPSDLDEAQTALQRARRKVEWLRLLEATEKQLATPSQTRTPDETTKLERLKADLNDLIGEARGTVRQALETAEGNAAGLIISAPVVRAHQILAKATAMVFAVGADAQFYSVDDQLENMTRAHPDESARPSLAIAELNEGKSDYTCRLYYVTEEGRVRCMDGNSVPPKSLHEWPGQDPPSREPGLRPRVESRLLWGSNAQGSGIFALPIMQHGDPSRLKVPQSQEWRWLEIQSDQCLALVATESSCRLVSYALNPIIVDRFAVKPDRAPYFSTFLPADLKVYPLLVAEFERDATRAGTGLAMRLLVANDVDVAVQAPPEEYAWFYPPLPTAILEDKLEGRGEWGPPVRMRTQPTIYLQNAYLMARDKTIQQQLLDLAKDTWAAYLQKVDQQYGGRANTRSKLGDVATPPLSGRDALYCYAIGGAVTEAQGRRAFEVLEDLRDLAKAVSLRFMQTNYDVYENRGLVLAVGKEAIKSRKVTLFHEDGRKFEVTTNKDGRVLLSREFDNKLLKMEPFGSTAAYPPVAAPRVLVKRGADNLFELNVYRKI
jgi:hypothetical protein